MSPIDKLTAVFKMFPGIGERQARRFVYFLLSRDAEIRTKLAAAIVELGDGIAQCSDCKRFFSHIETQSEKCTLCNDTARDRTTIMIVEKDTDLENIESSRMYKGQYFVLGGTAPIMSETLAAAELLRSAELLSFITALQPSEVILGFSTSPEGGHTADLVATALSKQKFETPFTLSRLGRGLSTGAELEYADPATLEAALKSRTE